MAKSKRVLWRKKLFSLVAEAAAFNILLHAVPKTKKKRHTHRTWSTPAFTRAGSQVKQECLQDVEAHIRCGRKLSFCLLCCGHKDTWGRALCPCENLCFLSLCQGHIMSQGVTFQITVMYIYLTPLIPVLGKKQCHL